MPPLPNNHNSQVLNFVVALFLLPESEVLLEELDDGLSILKVVFLEFVDLVEGLLEGAVGQGASFLVVLHHLVVEDGEVEGKAELDGVAGGKVDLVGIVVGFEGLLLDFLKLSIFGVLGNVAVVVADHLDEESLGLVLAVSVEDLGVDDLDDALAVVVQLLLNVVLVEGEGFLVLVVLGVALDGGDGAAGGALA